MYIYMFIYVCVQCRYQEIFPKRRASAFPRVVQWNEINILYGKPELMGVAQPPVSKPPTALATTLYIFIEFTVHRWYSIASQMYFIQIYEYICGEI